jgi:hypothetical protein
MRSNDDYALNCLIKLLLTTDPINIEDELRWNIFHISFQISDVSSRNLLRYFHASILLGIRHSALECFLMKFDKPLCP